MTYHYFISYSYDGGFGNTNSNGKFQIKYIDEIRKLEQQIAKEQSITGVVILNYILLRTEDK